MNQLITDEMISRYVIKEVYSGKTFIPIFRYSGVKNLDSDEVEIGFRCPDGEEICGRIYVPTVREDGLLQKNKTIWHKVTVCIPPMKFHGFGKYPESIHYLNNLIDNRVYNSKLVDFLPNYSSRKPWLFTPLAKELYNRQSLDVNDTKNWIVLDISKSIIELFNAKIVEEIERFGKGGYLGINLSVRAIHTLMRAFTGYDDLNRKSLYVEEEYEDKPIGKISIEDKRSILICHPIMKDININPNTPIDFCTCSQSRPIETARIRDGVEIIDSKFTGGSSFPYTEWRRSIVGIQNDDPHRVIVSKAITRAMDINGPDHAWAITDHNLEIDSLSLPGVRFTHPQNCEDGIIVSETFADKAGAFKLSVDRITVPKSVGITILKTTISDGLERDIAMEIGENPRSRDISHSNSIIRKGNVLAILTYNTGGKQVTEEFISAIKLPSVLVSIDSFSPVNDLNEENITYRFISLTYLPLMIGDKVSDAHGNKSTVSEIFPDSEMPVWDDGCNRILCHYIATPYIMKRLAVGAEIEDKLALLAFTQSLDEEKIVQVVVDSREELSMSNIDMLLEEEGIQYTSNVEFGNELYNNIPICMRTMYRLDNSAVDSLSTKSVKLSLDTISLAIRDATCLFEELIDDSGCREQIADNVFPILNAISDIVPDGEDSFEINKRLDRTILGNPTSMDKLAEVDLTDTTCDPRMINQYGIIKAGKWKVVIPPHDPLLIRYGTAMPSNIAVSANRVIADIISANSGYKVDIAGKINAYKQVISGKITGKDGSIRKSLPRFKYGVRAVATSIIADDPLLIMVPSSSFFGMYNNNPELKETYHKSLEDHNMFCLLKRDPVHCERHVVGVRMKLWNRKTIGIHPLLMTYLNGDFDGDSVTAMFPTTWGGYSEVKSLIPYVEDLPKEIKNVIGPCTSVEETIYELNNCMGYTSTFNNPHQTDVLKNKDLFDSLVIGHATDTDRINAVQDFLTIKSGTANVGAQVLSYIATKRNSDIHGLRSAMEMYHKLAQNTLDAKSGISVPAINICSAFRAGDADTIRLEMANLEFTDKKCIDQFIDFAVLCSESDGRLQYVTEHYPVHACMQNNAGYDQTLELIEFISDRTHIADSIWEQFLMFLIDKDNKQEEVVEQYNIAKKWEMMLGNV